MSKEHHALEAAFLETGDEIEEPATITPLPAFTDNRRPPAYEVANEQPWHRSCAYMLLQGHSDGEVAKYFDKKQATITNLKKQPWFKTLLSQLAEHHFDDDITGLLKNSAYDAISTLTDLTTGAKSESVRRAAASDLLDKFLKHVPQEPEETAADPQEELDRLENEIKTLKENG